MKKTLIAITFALAITASPALAHTNNPSVTIPSMRNSGAGVYGLAGTEDGPAVRAGKIGSAVNARTYKLSVSEQDTSNIPALSGTESGRAVEPPHLS